MKDNIIIAILVVVIVVGGVYLYKREKAQMSGNAESIAMDKTETFEGVLPCADCEGIKTEINFSSNKEKTGGTFIEKSTYLGAPSPSSFDKTGTWKVVTGRNKKPDAVIYVLTSKPDEAEAYELIDSTHLQLLDGEMQPISAPGQNFILTKRTATTN